MNWREINADQNLRMANKMLEQQGEINELKAENKRLRAELTDPQAMRARYERLQRIEGSRASEILGERRNVVADGPGPDWTPEVTHG